MRQHSGSQARTRMLRLLFGLLLALTATACSEADNGVGVASAGGTGTASASPESGGQGDASKFAQCMRDNGIENWPDPDPHAGADEWRGGSLPEGANQQEVDAAAEQCRQYLPNGGEPPEMDPESLEQQRRLAQCMRENGVPDMPDPPGDGAIPPPPSDIDPDSPEFQAAQEACQDIVSESKDDGGDAA